MVLHLEASWKCAAIAAAAGDLLPGTAASAGAQDGPSRLSRPPFLFGLHVLGVLKRVFIDKDDTLKRMIG